MFAELRVLMDQIEEDKDIKVVVMGEESTLIDS